MALSDTWLKEFEEAMKLADDISGRLRERENIVSSGGDPSHLISSTRRKITDLGTCLDRLESLLQNPPEKPRLNQEEVYRRQDMLLGIRFKTKQMASSFSTSPSNRAALSSFGEGTLKKSLEPVKVDIPDSNVTLLPPKQAITTRQHAVVDVMEDSSLHTRLLHSESETPNVPTKEDEDRDSSKGCNPQLLCLITLGILVLLLLVWTIVKIW
ncbi:hypothetical protein GOP47_0027780 [Adiantum capillus-veneris]|nr:hypothetical protein GOP47_0027780 [Adiantum capillus-veneris]